MEIEENGSSYLQIVLQDFELCSEGKHCLPRARSCWCSCYSQRGYPSVAGTLRSSCIDDDGGWGGPGAGTGCCSGDGGDDDGDGSSGGLSKSGAAGFDDLSWLRPLLNWAHVDLLPSRSVAREHGVAYLQNKGCKNILLSVTDVKTQRIV